MSSRWHLVVAVLLSVAARGLAAQDRAWSAFIAGGAVGFGGASKVAESDEILATQFKPASGSRLHVGVTRDIGRWNTALDLSYAKLGVGGYAGDVSYVVNPGMDLLDIRLLGSYRLLGSGGSSLRLGLGPMLQVWSGDAIVDTQTRIGGVAALTVTAPLTKALGLLLTGSLGVAGSPFDAELLADTGPVEPTAVWTRELAAGITFSWH